ncbi:MAG: hemin uptake protein HemP [Pseudomonadota bacterium]
MNDREAGKAPVRVTAADGRRRLDSIALLGCGNELIIAHGGEEYRLRLTRQGKLILTK